MRPNKLLESLEFRLCLSSGTVDTSSPYFFATSDVPNIMAWINNPSHSHVSELQADVSLVAQYVDHPGTYVPGGTLGQPQEDRGDLWRDMAILYRYISIYGNSGLGTTDSASAFSNELVAEVKAFYSTYSVESVRVSGDSSHNPWTVLDCASRAPAWVDTYYLMYGTSPWNSTAKSDFNTMLGLQGDWIYDHANPTDTNVPNQREKGYAALYLLGETTTYVGFNATPTTPGQNNNNSAASDWLIQADDKIPNEVFDFQTGADGDFRPDGGQYEQSPGYSADAIDDLVRVGYLEAAVDAATSASPVIMTSTDTTELGTATDALYNLVDQTGNFVPTGDTDLTTPAMAKFTLPSMFLNSGSRWNYNGPDIPTVLVAWKDSSDLLTAEGKGSNQRPSSGRTDAYQPNSGFAELRSSSATEGQLTFDAGPYGSAVDPSGSTTTLASGHGQFDLLNVDLSAYARQLLTDPGYANNVSQEATYSHSTIDVINSSGYYMNNGAYGFNDGHPSSDNDTSANSYYGATQVTGSGYDMIEAADTAFNSVNGTHSYRTVWSNGSGVSVIMDWTTSTSATTVESGFNLGNGAYPLTSGGLSGYRSGYGSTGNGDGGGNVWVAPLTVPSSVSPNRNQDYNGTTGRVRFTDSGTNLCFLTLVYEYSSSFSPPTVTVGTVNTSTGSVPITVNGTNYTLSRYNTSLTGVAPTAQATAQSYTAPMFVRKAVAGQLAASSAASVSNVVAIPPPSGWSQIQEAGTKQDKSVLN